MRGQIYPWLRTTGLGHTRRYAIRITPSPSLLKCGLPSMQPELISNKRLLQDPDWTVPPITYFCPGRRAERGTSPFWGKRRRVSATPTRRCKMCRRSIQFASDSLTRRTCCDVTTRLLSSMLDFFQYFSGHRPKRFWNDRKKFSHFGQNVWNYRLRTLVWWDKWPKCFSEKTASMCKNE